MTRTAVITGGQSGLGAAAIHRFKREGIRTVSFDVAPGADFVVDVRDERSVQDAIAQVGQVDILVNSAGIVGPNMPLVKTSLDAWQLTFDINVTGIFNMCKAVIPGMVDRGWGRIINLASVAGKEGNPNLSAYSASKAAVIGLTKSLGKELATSGVLVNAITPAVVATPMNNATSEEMLKYMIAKIPMGRVGTADEVASMIYWLSTDECSFTTASVFDISGGRTTY